MSQQQSRKRLHQSASTGPVKEEPLEQQQTEEETNSIGGGGIGTFNFENTIGNGGNGDDTNELKLKVAALEVILYFMSDSLKKWDFLFLSKLHKIFLKILGGLFVLLISDYEITTAKIPTLYIF
jgi:hypothetical protein